MSAHGHAVSVDAKKLKLSESSILYKMPLIAGVLGVIGLAATWALSGGDKGTFFFSYHVAFMFFLSIALGGLFFVIVQFAARAGWSVVVRRFAEAIAATLPLFALLFIPIAVGGMHTLFHHWTDLEAVKADKWLSAKQGYLNEPFFYIRAVIYFVIWVGLSRFFFTNSVKQDATGDHGLTRKMQKVSYPSIALFALSLTFAAVDWLMSLDPHWFSTMFGVYYFSGSVIAIYATLIIVVNIYKGQTALHQIVTVEHMHDLGKLLFAHTVFWAYIAFSQFFLIWYANIPEETMWYGNRINNGWLGVSIFLAVGHFIVPFFFLLPRTIKRTKPLLMIGALWQLALHFIDIYWLVMPTHSQDNPHFGLVDIAAVVGVGGLFVGVFTLLLRKNVLVPTKDPRLPESITFENI